MRRARSGASTAALARQLLSSAESRLLTLGAELIARLVLAFPAGVGLGGRPASSLKTLLRRSGNGELRPVVRLLGHCAFPPSLRQPGLAKVMHTQGASLASSSERGERNVDAERGRRTRTLNAGGTLNADGMLTADAERGR